MRVHRYSTFIMVLPVLNVMYGSLNIAIKIIYSFFRSARIASTNENATFLLLKTPSPFPQIILFPLSFAFKWTQNFQIYSNKIRDKCDIWRKKFWLCTMLFFISSFRLCHFATFYCCNWLSYRLRRERKCQCVHVPSMLEFWNLIFFSICLLGLYVSIPLCARSLPLTFTLILVNFVKSLYVFFLTSSCIERPFVVVVFSPFFQWKRAYILWIFIFISHNCLECMHNIHMPLVFLMPHTKRSNSVNAGHPFLYLRIYTFIGFFVLDICSVIAAAAFLMLLLFCRHTRNKKYMHVCVWSKFSNLWLLLY